MTMIENNIYPNNDYLEVEIVHPEYRCVVKLDNDDIDKIKRLRLSNAGYALISGGQLLHRCIMNCTKGDGLQVDHINGDKLDNRKSNLRVVSESVNKRNTHTFSRNNTGVIGIQQRSNGGYEYFRVSWRDSDGNRGTKQFNINDLGYDLAFEKAKDCLVENKEKYGYLIK